MLYIDAKYANILSTRLRNFKQKKDYLWNYSCPVCGDSARNKLKARGYIYRKKSDLFVKCHNCNYGSNIGNFIKYIDENLYNEYVLERYKSGTSKHNSHKEIDNSFFETETVKVPDATLSSLQRIDQLDENHPALKYIVDRKIPKDKWNLLYFATKFKEYTNSVKQQFSNLEDDHPRLIIPFFDEDNNVFAFQARAFGKETPKYYTIKLDESREKVYGLERVEKNETIYIVEGPIDSLFLPNSIAVSGASFDTPLVRDLLGNSVIVMDNEPRSKEITKQIQKYIDAGYTICLFPDTMPEKDINEMILAGYSMEEIVSIIDGNAVSGVEAMLKFAQWRKC